MPRYNFPNIKKQNKMTSCYGIKRWHTGKACEKIEDAITWECEHCFRIFLQTQGVDKRSWSSRTPLMNVARTGNIGLAGLLISLGADIHAKTTDGATVLGLAVTNRGDGAARMVRLLIRNGANVHECSNSGSDVIDQIMECNERVEMGFELIEAGAKSNNKRNLMYTEIRSRLENCRQAVRTVMCIIPRRDTKATCLLDKNVARMIAKYIWSTRRDKEWKL
jgi:hypothetical protein